MEGWISRGWRGQGASASQKPVRGRRTDGNDAGMEQRNRKYGNDSPDFIIIMKRMKQCRALVFVSSRCLEAWEEVWGGRRRVGRRSPAWSPGLLLPRLVVPFLAYGNQLHGHTICPPPIVAEACKQAQ